MQTCELSRSVTTVRLETPECFAAIRRVNMGAFGRPAEANLVDVLRRHGQLVSSLVAAVEGEVVGHAVLTQATIIPRVAELRMLALGPVAVLPEFQRQGIGALLIREALGQARAEGWQVMSALGNPDYSTRFGFVPARQVGLKCEFRVPAETFMVLELQPGRLEAVHGVVRYSPEFSGF